MIRARFFTKEKDVMGFVIRGHAGYRPYGEDIVCAAVSALTQNTVQSLVVIGGLTRELQVVMTEGYLFCGIRPACAEVRKDPVIQGLFRSLKLGISDIAGGHPLRVQYDSKEV